MVGFFLSKIILKICLVGLHFVVVWHIGRLHIGEGGERWAKKLAGVHQRAQKASLLADRVSELWFSGLMGEIRMEEEEEEKTGQDRQSMPKYQRTEKANCKTR